MDKLAPAGPLTWLPDSLPPCWVTGFLQYDNHHLTQTFTTRANTEPGRDRIAQLELQLAKATAKLETQEDTKTRQAQAAQAAAAIDARRRRLQDQALRGTVRVLCRMRPPVGAEDEANKAARVLAVGVSGKRQGGAVSYVFVCCVSCCHLTDCCR